MFTLMMNVHLSRLLVWGHFEVVKYLVEGFGANVIDTLSRAAWGGRLDIIKYLVERGADVHAGNESAFCEAVFEKNLEVVKYFVEEHNVDVHANNDYALRLAFKWRNSKFSNYLRTYDVFTIHKETHR